MIYIPGGCTLAVKASFIAGNKIMAWWFNPVNAVATKIGLQNKNEKMIFTCPRQGDEHDWVLVRDNPINH